MLAYSQFFFFFIIYFHTSPAEKCLDGCARGVCDGYSGQCVNMCIPGRSGPFCCLHGYHGSDCNSTCLLNCFFCTSSSSCITCFGGFYGNRCTQCPEHCTRCSSGTICSACDNGFFGRTCTKRCSPGCKLGSCYSETGRCNYKCRYNYDGLNCSECKIGFHGDDCTEKCSHGCIDGVCLFNGKCVHGCKSDSYIGDNCHITDGTNGTPDVNTESVIGNVVYVQL